MEIDGENWTQDIGGQPNPAGSFCQFFFFSFSEAHSSKVIMVHQNSKGLLTQGPLRSLANVSSEILTKQIPY